MVPIIIAMVIVLVLAVAILGMVVVGMEGQGSHRAPEFAGALGAVGRHLNGDAEAPASLVAVFEEADSSADELRQLPTTLRRRSGETPATWGTDGGDAPSAWGTPQPTKQRRRRKPSEQLVDEPGTTPVGPAPSWPTADGSANAWGSPEELRPPTPPVTTGPNAWAPHREPLTIEAPDDDELDVFSWDADPASGSAWGTPVEGVEDVVEEVREPTRRQRRAERKSRHQHHDDQAAPAPRAVAPEPGPADQQAVPAPSAPDARLADPTPAPAASAWAPVASEGSDDEADVPPVPTGSAWGVVPKDDEDGSDDVPPMPTSKHSAWGES